MIPSLRRSLHTCQMELSLLRTNASSLPSAFKPIAGLPINAPRDRSIALVLCPVWGSEMELNRRSGYLEAEVGGGYACHQLCNPTHRRKKQQRKGSDPTVNLYQFDRQYNSVGKTRRQNELRGLQSADLAQSLNEPRLTCECE
jgi:hypothetical protein